MASAAKPSSSADTKSSSNSNNDSKSPLAGSGEGNGKKKGYSAVGDAYGMLGLHSILKANEQDAHMMMLTRGFDLNTLGMPLAQSEPLHPTFCSPWSDASVKVQPDVRIPQCYFVSPPHLKFAMFQKFQLETLFYIFYSMPRDVLQLAAAQELHNRDWWYHKEAKQWMQRIADPTVNMPSFERGSYIFWNPEKWQKERREDFLLVYDQLEDRDQQNNAAAQAGAAAGAVATTGPGAPPPPGTAPPGMGGPI